MTEDTRKAALAKLAAITYNVGYPKKWRDYSAVDDCARRLPGQRHTYGGSCARSAISTRSGKPTDKTEWNMTTPTVNAFYSSAV